MIDPPIQRQRPPTVRLSGAFCDMRLSDAGFVPCSGEKCTLRMQPRHAAGDQRHGFRLPVRAGFVIDFRRRVDTILLWHRKINQSGIGRSWVLAFLPKWRTPLNWKQRSGSSRYANCSRKCGETIPKSRSDSASGRGFGVCDPIRHRLQIVRPEDRQPAILRVQQVMQLIDAA